MLVPPPGRTLEQHMFRNSVTEQAEKQSIVKRCTATQKPCDVHNLKLDIYQLSSCNAYIPKTAG